MAPGDAWSPRTWTTGVLGGIATFGRDRADLGPSPPQVAANDIDARAQPPNPRSCSRARATDTRVSAPAVGSRAAASGLSSPNEPLT